MTHDQRSKCGVVLQTELGAHTNETARSWIRKAIAEGYLRADWKQGPTK